MFRLGIDIGASSCRLILMNGKNEISWRKSYPHHNKVKKLIADSLEEIHRIAGDESVLLSVCGTMSHLLGLPPEYTSSETIAMTQAIGRYYPSASSCIMIGAQNTLADEFEKSINLSLAVANLDFEHGLNEEDALSFLHNLTV